MLFRQLHKLPTIALEALAAEARSEGYRFLDRLRDEWESGLERFDGRGEKLIGAFDGERLVGIGGVPADPCAAEPRIGRLRRVYVAPGVRRSGFASNLVAALLVDAGLHFDIVRLRVPDDRAARFYEKLGFEPVSIPNASHILKLA